MDLASPFLCYAAIVYSRLLRVPEKSFFLLGPRGTGKSSWARSQLPDAHYIDLLKASEFTKLQAAPDRLDGMIPKGSKRWVVIDEIQRIPELLNEVHRLIESRRLRFML